MGDAGHPATCGSCGAVHVCASGPQAGAPSAEEVRRHLDPRNRHQIDVAYQNGYAAGHALGYWSGYQEGCRDGHRAGFWEGIEYQIALDEADWAAMREHIRAIEASPMYVTLAERRGHHARAVRAAAVLAERGIWP